MIVGEKRWQSTVLDLFAHEENQARKLCRGISHLLDHSLEAAFVT
jgi:hypothetical protein